MHNVVEFTPRVLIVKILHNDPDCRLQNLDLHQNLIAIFIYGQPLTKF